MKAKNLNYLSSTSNILSLIFLDSLKIINLNYKLSLFLFLIYIIFSSLDLIIYKTDFIPANQPISFIFSVITFFIMLMIIKFSMFSLTDKNINLRELLPGFTHFIKLIVLALLFALGLVLGLMIFIVPGIIFFINYYFVIYSLVNKNKGIIASFQESYDLISGKRLRLLPAYILINISFILTIAGMYFRIDQDLIFNVFSNIIYLFTIVLGGILFKKLQKGLI